MSPQNQTLQTLATLRTQFEACFSIWPFVTQLGALKAPLEAHVSPM